MDTVTPPYRRSLADGLTLSSIASEDDLQRVSAFNRVIHGSGVADMTRELVLHHQNTRPEQWLYVANDVGQVVSTSCLIPWTWSYDGVPLRVGEIGIMGTHKTYRHRGLVHAQFERHHEMLRQGGYDLAVIQGIPYFYRQFGFEYAIPLEGGWRVELYAVPPLQEGEREPYTFRLATERDISALSRMYDQAAADLDVHALRDAAVWQYLLGPSTRTEMRAETWLLEDGPGDPVGYVRVPAEGFGNGLICNEASRLAPQASEATLRHLRSLAEERGKPFIRLCLPSNSILVQTAQQLGAHDLGRYAWQIHVVEVGALLQKLGPVLERRLACSAYAGLTDTLCLNLYRQAWELCFRDGRLAAVKAVGFRDSGDVALPPQLAAPLLLGYRTLGELRHAYPDVQVLDRRRNLADVLFAHATSYIYTIY